MTHATTLPHTRLTAVVVRAAINAAPIGRVDPESLLHRILDSVLAHHPSVEAKRSGGVAGFAVRRGGRRGVGRAVFIVRPDGSEEAFSWVKCCHRRTDRSVLDNAYRFAVLEQIDAFRGTLENPSAWHVDHADPWPFFALVDAFEAQHGTPAVSDLVDSPDGFGRVLPPQRARDFADFHRERAILRALTPAENQARGSTQRRGSR